MRAIALTLACWLVVSGAQGETQLPSRVIALDAAPAPQLRLEDLDGTSFDLDSARGQWVFVHFWASWCGPCRREMPTIARMAEKLGEHPLRIVLVNTAETPDEAFTFLAAVAPELNTLLDGDGRVTERWEPRGLPATFLVDPEGRLRYMALGGRTWDEQPYLGFLRRLDAGGR